MDHLAILNRIEQADPEGWTTREPTDRDRAAFRRWVEDKYGKVTAATYFAGGWNPWNGDW